MASHLLRSVLSPAVRRWIQSQVDSVGELELAIESSDRQLLSGRIPWITIAAKGLRYKELHLGQIDVEGRDIAVNLSQVMRGKPLQLLAPIAISTQVTLSEADLNASLASALLAPVWLDWRQQLADRLLGSGRWELGSGIEWGTPRIAIGSGTLTLRCGIQSFQGQETERPFELTAIVALSEGRILTLKQPCWTIGAESRGEFEDLVLDLGETVTIDSLQLQSQTLTCQGQLWVQP
jgi:LmeA-like phospholipid-binding